MTAPHQSGRRIVHHRVRYEMYPLAQQSPTEFGEYCECERKRSHFSGEWGKVGGEEEGKGRGGPESCIWADVSMNVTYLLVKRIVHVRAIQSNPRYLSIINFEGNML